MLRTGTALLAWALMIHLRPDASAGNNEKVISPPVSLEKARAELLKYPLARELGVSSAYPLELGPDEWWELPQRYFSLYLVWHSKDDNVRIGAYDASSVTLDMCIEPEDGARFYGRSGSREELLKLKKPDDELDRIAVDYAKRYCPWFQEFNDRFVTSVGFASTYRREVWFLRRIGSVWCSTYCRVGVEVVTGRVVFYQQYYAPCDLPATPIHTPQEAARLGMISLNFKKGIYKEEPEKDRQRRPYADGNAVITGTDALGCQRLAWIVHVECETSDGKEGGVYLLVDDQSGEALGIEPLLEEPAHKSEWITLPENPEGKVERLPTIIDGPLVPVLFPPIRKDHRIYLFVDCLRPWGFTARVEDGAVVVLDREGQEVSRTNKAWDRRGLKYIPLEPLLSLMKNSIRIMKTNDKTSVSFILPRHSNE